MMILKTKSGAQWRIDELNNFVRLAEHPIFSDVDDTPQPAPCGLSGRILGTSMHMVGDIIIGACGHCGVTVTSTRIVERIEVDGE